MEEERTDEMEVAEKKDEEGKKKENEGLGMILQPHRNPLTSKL